MRHRKSGRKLGMDSSARKAMFRNMVTSLMLHGQIRTTEHRAKELRKHADRVITLGKKAPSVTEIGTLDGDAQQQASANRVHAIRRVKLWVNNDEAISKIFGEYAERFANRAGGYTRIVKTGRRDGDNAKMAVIQLVPDMLADASEAAPVEVEAAPVESADDEPTTVADGDTADEEATVVAETLPEASEEDK